MEIHQVPRFKNDLKITEFHDMQGQADRKKKKSYFTLVREEKKKVYVPNEGGQKSDTWPGSVLHKVWQQVCWSRQTFCHFCPDFTHYSTD